MRRGPANDLPTPPVSQVPPIIISLLRNRDICAEYDISSVRYLFTGAAPLGAETHEDMSKAFPGLKVGQVSCKKEQQTHWLSQVLTQRRRATE